MVDRLAQRLSEAWTVRARDGHGEVCLPKFAPRSWIADGKLDRGRLMVLRGAGWEIQEINNRRYLLPDEELTRYTLGWAYEDYLRVIGGLSSPSPLVGEGRVREAVSIYIWSTRSFIPLPHHLSCFGVDKVYFLMYT